MNGKTASQSALIVPARPTLDKKQDYDDNKKHTRLRRRCNLTGGKHKKYRLSDMSNLSSFHETFRMKGS